LPAGSPLAVLDGAARGTARYIMRMISKAAGVAVTAFGMAVVLTNSARSLDWNPVHLNIIGFVCMGIGGILRMARRESKPGPAA
jgi:hypothetical protein